MIKTRVDYLKQKNKELKRKLKEAEKKAEFIDYLNEATTMFLMLKMGVNEVDFKDLNPKELHEKYKLLGDAANRKVILKER